MRYGQVKMSDEQITEMLELYAQTTMSSVAIGALYGRDHTTVLYHIKRRNVVRGAIIVTTVTTRRIHVKHDLANIEREVPQPAEPIKDYDYYVRKEQERKLALKHGKNFPVGLCINHKKRKVPSDIMDIGVDVVM